MVPSCWAPGSQMTKAEEYRFLGCVGKLEKGGLWIGQFAYQGYVSGWVFCYTSKNWLAYEEVICPPARKVFKDVKTSQNLKNICNTIGFLSEGLCYFYFLLYPMGLSLQCCTLLRLYKIQKIQEICPFFSHFESFY